MPPKHSTHRLNLLTTFKQIKVKWKKKSEKATRLTDNVLQNKNEH